MANGGVSTLRAAGLKGIQAILLAAFFAVLAPWASAAQIDHCQATGRSSTTIPFTLIGDHIYVDATVNGTGPYRFIVDTGGVNLIDDSLVRKLSLKVTGKETGHGTGPEVVETGTTSVEQITIGDVKFSSEGFYVFDFGQLYPGGGVKMLGMLGALIFRDYVTCIDFENSVIDLIEPANFDARKSGLSLPIAVKGGDITVWGSFDRIPGVFQIDTGSPATLTLSSPFITRHNLLKRFPQKVETSSGGVGGTTREYTVRGRDLVLGFARIAHPITALSVTTKGNLANSHLAGIVGIGALKRYVVTVDFPGKRLFLRTLERTPRDLDTYDRSGMRIELASTGFRVVTLSPGGPAAEAGLHAGDIIVEVDGQPASSISLPALRDELRQRPAGATIALVVDSSKGRRNLRLTLRNLL